MTREIPGPMDAAEMRRFLDCFLYREAAFYIDEILKMDADERLIEARMDTTRALPLASLQRNDAHHPPHVSAPEMLMVTASLGCLHAWFFHGCRWDEGWNAFGGRIHRADFRQVARIGPPLRLESREIRRRIGPERVVIRYAFSFWQSPPVTDSADERPAEVLVYSGDQTAVFFKNSNHRPEESPARESSDLG